MLLIRRHNKQFEGILEEFVSINQNQYTVQSVRFRAVIVLVFLKVLSDCSVHFRLRR